jgi:hypothetical protein
VAKQGEKRMTTQLVRDVMKHCAESGQDPTVMHWFDATGCLNTDKKFSQDCLHLNRPPFPICMVCWQGSSDKNKNILAWLWVCGNDPEEGIAIQVWRKPPNLGSAIVAPTLWYFVKDGLVHYRALDELQTLTKEDAEMTLGFVGAWYESLSKRNEAYVPNVQQTFTNKRKIAQGKVPTYEWRTVTIEAVKPRKESKGGTHASPRLHDRRGHMRRLASGKTVWVKNCKVGNSANGIVFHDYKIAEAA